MPLKVVITGATGMLGQHLFRVFSGNPAYEVYAVSRNGAHIPADRHIQLDMTDTAKLEKAMAALQPVIVIYAAALVNVDLCERDRDYAYTLHVTAAKMLSELPSVKSFVYISSDAVFDGQHGNYVETDSCNPLNYYATTKMLAERELLKGSSDIYVIRVNIYGFHATLENSLFEWAWKSFNEGKQITGFDNVYFNPLYVGTLARLILELYEKKIAKGIYHFGTSDGLSKYDFLLSVVNAFKFDGSLLLKTPLDPSKFEAPRPLNTTLNTDKIVAAGIKMPSFEEGMVELVNDFKKDIEK
jgi:dTDP-4-dehydrorhamnose reductase